MKKHKNSGARKMILVLLAIFAFGIMAPAVLAESDLTSGSPARVANTDGEGVRMRQEPSVIESIIAHIDENELVIIKGGPTTDERGNSFYKVEYNGQTGYVAMQYLIFAGRVAKGIKTLPVGSAAKVVHTDGEGVNFRQQASGASSVLAVLPENTLTTIMGGPFADKQGNNYYRVDYKGQAGYISLAYLEAAPNSSNTGTSGNLRVSNTDGDPVRFRSGPGLNFGSSGYVYEGQVLKGLSNAVVDDNGNKWYRVQKDDVVGYVGASYLIKTELAPTLDLSSMQKTVSMQSLPGNGSLGERIAAFAQQYVGYRYLEGGKSPNAGGFDCSGLVFWALKNFGIRAGYDSVADVEIGRPVSLNALQPGDILIWANTYKPGPSHVGIYIGNGKFVHAENESSGVTISKLSSDYYASRFYGARRVV
jgi:uncharacterized protein YgiM (DUF1202 family)